MKNYRILFYFLGLLFLVFPFKSSESCGGYEEEHLYFRKFSFFEPDSSMIQKTKRDFFDVYYAPDFDYQHFRLNRTIPQEANLEEWQKFFYYQFKKEDLKLLIYKLSLSETYQVLAYVQNQANTLADSLKAKPLISACKEKQWIDFLNYLIYAKQCEKHTDKGQYKGWEKNFNKSLQKFEITYDVSGKKQSIYEISRVFKVAKNDLLYWNQLPMNQYDVKTNTKLKIQAKGFEYTVQPNDTWQNIASYFKIKVDDLLTWNNLDDKVPYHYQVYTQKKQYLKPNQEIILRFDPRKIPNLKRKDVVREIYSPQDLSRKGFKHYDWDDLFPMDKRDYEKLNRNIDPFTQRRNNDTLIFETYQIKHITREGETVEDLEKKYRKFTYYGLSNYLKIWGYLQEDTNPSEEPKPKKYEPLLLEVGQKILILEDSDLYSENDLMAMGEKAYQNINSDFLKLRYAYQMIRLMHYAIDYQKCVYLFEKYAQPHQSLNSIIYYWALEHCAGAYIGLKNLGKGNALFAEVFLKCPSRRRASYLSFQITDEVTWQQALAASQDDEQRAALYLMRGLQPKANGLEEMQNIYQFHPKAKALELLMMREINKLEMDLLRAEPNQNVLLIKNYIASPHKNNFQYLNAMQIFINKCVNEKATLNPEIWELALGYLKYLGGNAEAAKTMFRKLKTSSTNQNIQNQCVLFELFVDITQIQKLDNDKEDIFYKRILNLPIPPQFKKEKIMIQRGFNKPHISEQEFYRMHLLEFAGQLFSAIYENQGDLIKAYLSQNTFTSYNFKLKNNYILTEGLVKLVEKQNKSEYEKFLLLKVGEDERAQKNFAYELKGTILLRQNTLMEAIESFKKMPDPHLHQWEIPNPFLTIPTFKEENIIQKEKFSKLRIAEKMLALEEKIQTNSKQKAEAMFQLANIYFNLTWQGYASSAVSFYWTDKNYGKPYPIQEEHSFKATNNFPDIEKALVYYDLALKQANFQGDKELAAKACFGAVACEYWNMIEDKNYQKADSDIDLRAIEWSYHTYMRLMKKQFADTQYFDKVIHECAYFNEFWESE